MIASEIEIKLQDFAAEILEQIESGCPEDYVIKLVNSWDKTYFLKELKIIAEQGVFRGNKEVLRSIEELFFPDTWWD